MTPRGKKETKNGFAGKTPAAEGKSKHNSRFIGVRFRRVSPIDRGETGG
jgi:hypothetical protein